MVGDASAVRSPERGWLESSVRTAEDCCEDEISRLAELRSHNKCSVILVTVITPVFTTLDTLYSLSLEMGPKRGLRESVPTSFNRK